MPRRIAGRHALTGIAGVLSIGALILAVLSPGVEVEQVDMNDGGVWVTNASRGLVAHVNVPARLLDSGFHAASAVFDVYQEGESVQVLDKEVGTLTPVDVAVSALMTPVEYSGMSTSVGGGTVAITDTKGGRVWVQPTSQMESFNTDEVEPTISGMPGAVATVDVTGGVHAVSAEAMRVVSSVPRGSLANTSEGRLVGVSAGDRLQIAAVGTTAVVWDADTSQLHLPGGQVRPIDAGSVVLQESGPQSDHVLLASADGLLKVPLKGGAVEEVPAPASGGVPSRPVTHQTCSYGAWSVTGAFVRDCPSDSDDREMVVESLVSAEKTVFRTNRDVIVLNDIEKDGLWLPDSDMILVDNWDQIESKLESEQESEEESVEETSESMLPDRTQENTPPVAVDDEFGVRAGRTTMLPVLMNDSDADGDFMTASVVSQPSIGEVSVAREGAALQIAVPAEATGASTFDYEVSDGRGGTARARVTVSVHGDEINGPPEQMVVPSVSLASGRRATVNALANWIDPDGDPFYLASATAPTGLSVRSHENGTVDITEAGHGVGKDAVNLRVSDGREEGEGIINVTVIDSGNEAPVANADHLVVREGSSATISPMGNDTDANGDTLRLVQIDQAPAGITAVMDGTTGIVTVEGVSVGTYYLSYVITDGPLTGTGVIRVDVVAADVELPPSVEDDMGVLADGGEALVDLLANDSDPTGGVLTVQQVDVPSGSSLVVALVDHHLARVTAPRGLAAPATFTYTVSNGAATAKGTVTILPKQAQAGSEPPELTDDSLVVRTGDVASVAVLDNDRSPGGLKLTVSNDLQHEIPSDLGTVFISNNVIRVRGGERAGSGRIVYTVSDTMGNVASAVVNLTVVAMDETTNTAPRPKEVTARTVAGRPVTLTIPLDGIDAEGDSTTLVGLGSAPRLGTATQVGSTFEYEPGIDSTGTDSFTYIVEDSLGKQAVGRIRVGIAPRAALNQNPIAMPDLVRVKPGTKVSVAVLANDIDPDGDPLTLDAGSLTSTTTGLDVSARNSRVVIMAPHDEGTHVVSYRVEDGAGGFAEGVCTVVVTENAPLLAPIARDDEVTLNQVQASSGAVTVDVLTNDEDPDGDIEDVTLTNNDDGVSVAADALVIATKPQARMVVYTVTDRDGLSASAVVRVPGTEVTRPILNTQNLPIRAKAGEAKDIALGDYIIAREGRSVMLTSESKVSAGLGWDGSPLVKDSRTLSFTASQDFSGSTSITVEVSDGADLNDSSGAVATVSLPIEVEGANNRPPVFTPTAIEVAPGEGAVASDLASWISDPDGDDPTSMTYRITTPIPDGLSASISGTTLSVSAGSDTAKGQAGSIGIEVVDHNGHSVTGTVPVTVVASSRPLIQTTPAQVTLNAGESQTVDVAQYATNPFADRGPLRVLPSPGVTDGGTASVSGTQITVSANAGFTGSFTVTYRLQDATADTEREVQGTITATVRDKPEPPSAVQAVSNSAGSALISWTAGSANGAPITGFTVTDHTQGDSKSCGLVTTCLFDGRRNGIDHAFSVTATNEVGESEPSAQAVVNIDIEPETPAAPTATPEDQQITVTWTAPHNEGSPITNYEVSLSPGGTVEVGNATSYTFTGLRNGAEYVVTVRAMNSKGWSQSSAPSRSVVPYGAPGAPSSVSASYANLGSGTGSSATIDVSWGASAPNGRAVEYYLVSVAGGTPKRVNGTQTSTSMEGIGFSNDRVGVTVAAVNDSSKADSHTSPVSHTSLWVVGQPLAPAAVSASATGNDNEVSLQWSPSPAGQGWNPSDFTYQWRVNGGGWERLSGTTLTGNGLTNGQTANIEIRAVGTKIDGNGTPSPTIGANSVTPYGPPIAPTMSCSGGVEKVSCSWSGGSGNGRDATYTLSGGDSGEVGASGSREYTLAGGVTHQLCVTVTQSESGKTAQSCSSATAQEQPPSTTLSMSGLSGTLTFVNSPHAGATVEIRCWNAAPGGEVWPDNKANKPGNYLGASSYVTIPKTGALNFTCHGNELDPSMRPNGNFHVNIVNVSGWSSLQWVGL